MILRARDTADLAALAVVLRRVHERHRYPVVWPDDAPAWIAGAADAGAWIAAPDDQPRRPVGHVGLCDNGDGTAWVERLFVDPQHASAGIGRSLLAAATSAALSAGLEPRLEVADNGEAALRLYRAAGWEFVDRQPVDWGGDVVDAVLRFRWPPDRPVKSSAGGLVSDPRVGSPGSS